MWREFKKMVQTRAILMMIGATVIAVIGLAVLMPTIGKNQKRNEQEQFAKEQERQTIRDKQEQPARILSDRERQEEILEQNANREAADVKVASGLGEADSNQQLEALPYSTPILEYPFRNPFLGVGDIPTNVLFTPEKQDRKLLNQPNYLDQFDNHYQDQFPDDTEDKVSGGVKS